MPDPLGTPRTVIALIAGLILSPPIAFGQSPAEDGSARAPAGSKGEPSGGDGGATGSESGPSILLEPQLVTATRSTQRDPFDLPFMATSVDRQQLDRRQYRTTPQALRDIPNIMVQETAFGHGSPYIRGFTSFRNLFLIDGIRLNGPHFRPGPNQYWNTVDPGSIQRLEVVKGPTSVLWGSDGIGGTVNAITKRPDTYGDGLRSRAGIHLRASSAEESFIGRKEVAGSIDGKIGFVGGFGGKTFGDLQTGGPEQEGTGYDEWNGDFKLEYFLNENVRIVGAHYQVRQNNVPRTHKTVDREEFESIPEGTLNPPAGANRGPDERKRELDQERDLTYVQLIGEDLGEAVDAFRASLSWQRQEEVRDRVKANGDRDLQGFEVGTLGFFTHLESPTPIGRLTYGLEYYHNNVNSFKTGNPIQGPLGDEAQTEQLGLFVQDEIELTDRLNVTLGGRYNYASVEADQVQDPDTGNRIRVEDEFDSFVGSARAVYELVPDRLNLFGGVSQGFRAPNLGDLTRFDTARSNEFETPAPGLEEERYVTYEIGSKFRGDDASARIAYFYNDIRDQILRFPTGDGRDTDGDGNDDEFEVTKDNVGDGRVFGVEFSGAWQFVPGWTVFGNVGYVEGEVTNFVGGAGNLHKREDYLSRLQPLRGQVGLRWDSPNVPFWAEGVLRLAGDADKLSARDKGDFQRIPEGGTPGYAVLSVRGGWRVNEQLNITGAVENVTDEEYRVHGSGQNRPGLNVILSMDMRF